jgi:hypothetical protein
LRERGEGGATREVGALAEGPGVVGTRLAQIGRVRYIDRCRYEVRSMKIFRKSEKAWVEFCERCGQLCDARCATSCAWERAIENVGPLRVAP